MAKEQAAEPGTDTVAPSNEPTIINDFLSDNPPNTVSTEEGEGKRPPMKDLTGVKYDGGPMLDSHTLTVDHLKDLGVENPQTDLIWNKDNGFTVPITDVNAETVDALIALPGYSAV